MRNGRNLEVSPVNVPHVLTMHREALDEHAKLLALLTERVRLLEACIDVAGVRAIIGRPAPLVDCGDADEPTEDFRKRPRRGKLSKEYL